MDAPKQYYVITVGECPLCHGAQEVKSGSTYNNFTGKFEPNFVGCPQCDGHGEAEVRVPLEEALGNIGSILAQMTVDIEVLRRELAEAHAKLARHELWLNNVNARFDANEEADANRRQRDLLDIYDRIREAT